ncbi:hypothetical protein [Hyalangium gracile]|uniref:hypothetical protein n=1 Tax=Hyalangium gracile TaxID=394092 RepID=UPI001CCF744C|nr:hypothetical protein [Hyalangium gracile]
MATARRFQSIATCPPSAWSVYFRRLPLQLGFASEVREPGQFITHRGDVPLLCVRGADGVCGRFEHLVTKVHATFDAALGR